MKVKCYHCLKVNDVNFKSDHQKADCIHCPEEYSIFWLSREGGGVFGFPLPLNWEAQMNKEGYREYETYLNAVMKQQRKRFRPNVLEAS